jgi:hypothetical protein
MSFGGVSEKFFMAKSLPETLLKNFRMLKSLPVMVNKNVSKMFNGQKG